ncbi:MAG: integration host factor, actinobacterial type [Actinomycetota bacterium]
MPLPPSLTDEQRRAALAKAAATRKVRAELKESLKSGRTGLKELLNSNSDGVEAKMKVVAVLESMPGVGKIRARRIMDRLDISQSRRVKGLGAKQKESLLKEFE